MTSIDGGDISLRIAVPNKGSLSEAARDMLREAGYRQRSNSVELVLTDPDNAVEFFYLRPRDIALYVGEGQLDLGITGRDLLLDSGAAAEEVLPLGFGGSWLRLAAPPGTVRAHADLTGLRVATSYARVVASWLDVRGVDASVVRLDGAVETAVRLGVADVIADVVETGSTLREAGLEVFGEPILESEAVLVRRAGTGTDAATDPSNGASRDASRDARAAAGAAEFDVFLRRLRGVLVARGYVMMDYDIAVERVDDACALTPGIESPTVSPLHRQGWVAVRAMVPRRDAQQVMDGLWDIGARGILVTDIHACRL